MLLLLLLAKTQCPDQRLSTSTPTSIVPVKRTRTQNLSNSSVHPFDVNCVVASGQLGNARFYL